MIVDNNTDPYTCTDTSINNVIVIFAAPNTFSPYAPAFASFSIKTGTLNFSCMKDFKSISLQLEFGVKTIFDFYQLVEHAYAYTDKPVRRLWHTRNKVMNHIN